MRAPLLQQRVEARGVGLDPAVAEAHESAARGAELGDLLFGEGLPLDLDAHREVDERVGAEGGARPRAEGHPHLRTRPSRPPVGHARLHPRGLAITRGEEEGVGLRGRPPEGLKELAGVDQGAHDLARGGGAAHGFEQGVEARAVLQLGALGEGATEGHVLRSPRRAHARGEGREEGEGRITLALREVETHAPHGVPHRALRAQPRGRGGVCDACAVREVELVPPLREELGGDVLSPAHRGHRGGQRFQRGVGRQRHRDARALRVEVGQRAQPGQEEPREGPQPRQGWGQDDVELARPEVQNPLLRRDFERTLDALPRGLVGDPRRVGVIAEVEGSVGGDRGRDHRGAHSIAGVRGVAHGRGPWCEKLRGTDHAPPFQHRRAVPRRDALHAPARAAAAEGARVDP